MEKTNSQEMRMLLSLAGNRLKGYQDVESY